ncbi:natural resistance-associated macrophage protein [Phlegmacium glaucopus]|nr:natural resistance-associated macrophage protein [Phlegmacium glaucopus]
MQESIPALPRNPVRRRTFAQRLRQAGATVVHHAKKHAGVGTVCAVAYFDPGNWGVDLQAGSQFGYHLLFVILIAGIFAAFLQVLASRLGCVTGLDLASHSRLLLYNRPKHKLLYRWLGLYPLYILAEVAIIATDLAELLGSAIALCLLFPKLELWHGVLITAFDVILILGMRDPLRGRPVRLFEVLIASMVLAVLICMIIIIAKVHVDWGDAFQGYIPSKYIFSSGGIYTSVGILGATVMPHSLFLGSALATQDRISFRPPPDAGTFGTVNTKEIDESSPIKPSEKATYLQRLFAESKEYILSAFRKPPASTAVTHHSERQNNPFEFVRAHVYHGMFDVVGSLLGFAVMINSLILMLASAVFFYGNDNTGDLSPASLFDAYDLIRDKVGKPAATLFAIALLAAGQSSSLIATVAGQAVSEGFLNWRISAVMRRVVTRLLAIIPSMAIAIAIGIPGINALLVASQVVLSIVLPFVTFPLLYCTSSRAIMSVRKKRTEAIDTSGALAAIDVPPEELQCQDQDPSTAERAEMDGDEMVDYSNNKLVIAIGVIFWLIIVAANLYVIVTLGLGGGT